MRPEQQRGRNVQDKQTLAQHMMLDIDRPGYGTVRTLGFPMKFSEYPWRVRRPAPMLGEHSEHIVAELEYPEAEPAVLRRDRDCGGTGLPDLHNPAGQKRHRLQIHFRQRKMPSGISVVTMISPQPHA